MIRIRPEVEPDYPAVRRINEEAFGQPAEAALVDALRSEVHPYVSLVADIDGEIVGHVFFSPVTIDDGETVTTAMALGPMAVRPSRQRRGIGTRLVRQGLAACRQIGHPVVFVLGHPEYYPRFGFAPAAPRGLRCTYPVPDDVFMVVELEPRALAGRRGTVRYHEAFDRM